MKYKIIEPKFFRGQVVRCKATGTKVKVEDFYKEKDCVSYRVVTNDGKRFDINECHLEEIK